jgi:hypothetical protein
VWCYWETLNLILVQEMCNILSIGRASVFVMPVCLFCFVFMRDPLNRQDASDHDLGLFEKLSMMRKGELTLVPWHLDLRCKSS